ncbi:hypothetical protein ACWEP3_06780, partial [Streptomyces albidoflavus]
VAAGWTRTARREQLVEDFAVFPCPVGVGAAVVGCGAGAPGRSPGHPVPNGSAGCVVITRRP